MINSPVVSLPTSAGALRLGMSGFTWPDLHTPEGLARLHDTFEAWLEERDPTGLELLRTARRDPDALDASQTSALVVRLAPAVGAFVGRLFAIEDEVARARDAVLAEEPVFHFRKHFVKKRLHKPTAVFEDRAEARAITEACVRV